MRYTNRHFTYLLTYLLVLLHADLEFIFGLLLFWIRPE